MTGAWGAAAPRGNTSLQHSGVPGAQTPLRFVSGLWKLCSECCRGARAESGGPVWVEVGQSSSFALAHLYFSCAQGGRGTSVSFGNVAGFPVSNCV